MMGDIQTHESHLFLLAVKHDFLNLHIMTGSMVAMIEIDVSN